MLVLQLSMLVLSWTVVSASNSAMHATTICPDLWIAFHGSCYFFGHQQLTFFEAEHYCQQHNSHLVEIESAIENAFIKDHISHMKESFWWIGLTDEVIEGVWEWYTSNTSPRYTYWYPGQPGVASLLDYEDCGVFAIQDGIWGWHDFNCSRQDMTPICEIK